MTVFEEYLEQSYGGEASSHYDEYTDRWVDEGGESIYGHSGYCDIHTDEP